MNAKFDQMTSQKGSTILIVMALIAMLTGIAIMSVDRSNTDMEMSFNQLHEEQAFYIAEAGLERALTALNEDYAWRTGYVNRKLEDGYYTVVLTDKSTKPLLADTVVAQATAKVLGASTNIEAWLVQGRKYPFSHAAYGDELLFMQNNACTDSYASDSGSYAATQSDSSGDVGSNDKVDLKNTVTIGGDVSSATAGSISIIDAPTIYGDTTTTADPQAMDLVSDADYTWAQANNSAPLGFIGTGYTYSGGNLEIQDSKTLTLKAGTYYFKSLSLKNYSELKLDTNADVKIFITGDVMVENGAKVNGGGMPSKLNVFTKGTSVNFKNDSEFRGSLYAPNCNFVHENNAGLYGAVIAKTVELKNDACIHYDRALSRSGYYIPGDYEILAWRQTD